MSLSFVVLMVCLVFMFRMAKPPCPSVSSVVRPYIIMFFLIENFTMAIALTDSRGRSMGSWCGL